jgi:Thioredoxin.
MPLAPLRWAMTGSDAQLETPVKPVGLADAAAVDAFVEEHPTALVEFVTRGCGICASLEPVITNVARAHDELAVGVVDARDDPVLIDRFTVSSVPLLIVFVDGTPTGRLAEGFQTGAAIDAFIADSV